MGPWLLLTALMANVWLADRQWARALLIAQLAAYGLGFASFWLRKAPFIGKASTGVWYFMALNAALLIGTLKYMSGRAAPIWQRTPRTAERMQRLRTQRGPRKTAARSQEDSPAA